MQHAAHQPSVWHRQWQCHTPTVGADTVGRIDSDRTTASVRLSVAAMCRRCRWHARRRGRSTGARCCRWSARRAALRSRCSDTSKKPRRAPVVATACIMHCGSHAHRHAQAHARLPTTMRTHWSPRPLGTAQRWRWRRSCERRAQASQIACCRGRDGGDAPDAPEEGPKQPVRSSTATLFGTQGPMRLRRNVDCANAGRTLANVAKPLKTMC